MKPCFSFIPFEKKAGLVYFKASLYQCSFQDAKDEEKKVSGTSFHVVSRINDLVDLFESCNFEESYSSF